MRGIPLADASLGACSTTSSGPQKGLLRFLTCGSVDDGKSTLIGRLLYDTKLLLDDQIAQLAADSRKHGTTGDDLDFALLVDGLQAEREQGITIDVAYRFFATPARRFIVADTPGHEQYTRNMATGASTADLAVLLVDARNGLLTQTRRHAFLVSLLGVRHVVLAVNKIDLVDYEAAAFGRIVEDFKAFSASLQFASVVFIPISARFGDNIIARSGRTPWYEGPALLEHLESVDIGEDASTKPFRLPVQWVSRPHQDFRGLAGTIASGRARAGDPVVIAGSGRAVQVRSIVTYDGTLEEAEAGEAVTLTLTEDIDVSRGDVLCSPQERPQVADQFAAHVVWMHEDPLMPGRPYLLKIGTRTVAASITEIKHREDVNTFQKLAAKVLRLNEVGFVNVETHEAIAFDPYDVNRDMGAFILIDRLSNLTVGAGMIRFGLRRATNVHWQALDVTKQSRAELKGQRPCCLWFTGLSGAGKSTIANLLEKQLNAHNRHTFILDGDNLRHGLNRDLGFTDADRVENIRRAAHVARLMVDAGLIVLVSFISPFAAERRMARELFDSGEFIEVFVDAPLEVCEARDVKGLYKKARAGQIQNFTGISSRYETPESPELRLEAGVKPAEALAGEIYAYLEKGGYI
jgi:bifunctional enzyme CysN/CysC